MEMQVDAAQHLDRPEALAQPGDFENRAHALTGTSRNLTPTIFFLPGICLFVPYTEKPIQPVVKLFFID